MVIPRACQIFGATMGLLLWMGTSSHTRVLVVVGPTREPCPVLALFPVLSDSRDHLSTAAIGPQLADESTHDLLPEPKVGSN